MVPPITKTIITKTKLLNIISIDKNVTIIANIIPKIQNKFQRRDVSGEDNPRRAKIKRIPETKYSEAAKL